MCGLFITIQHNVLKLNKFLVRSNVKMLPLSFYINKAKNEFIFIIYFYIQTKSQSYKKFTLKCLNNINDTPNIGHVCFPL